MKLTAKHALLSKASCSRNTCDNLAGVRLQLLYYINIKLCLNPIPNILTSEPTVSLRLLGKDGIARPALANVYTVQQYYESYWMQTWKPRNQFIDNQQWVCRVGPSKQAQWLSHLFSRKAEAGSITQRIGSASLGLVVLTISSIKLVPSWWAQLTVRLSVPPSFQFLPVWVKKLAWICEWPAYWKDWAPFRWYFQPWAQARKIAFRRQWSRRCMCFCRNKVRSELGMVIAKSSKGVPPHCRVEYQITHNHMHSLHAWSFFNHPVPSWQGPRGPVHFTELGNNLAILPPLRLYVGSGTLSIHWTLLVRAMPPERPPVENLSLRLLPRLNLHNLSQS